MRQPSMRFPVACLLGLAPMTVSAAGGHFVVDDTVVAGPGNVVAEVWYSRQSSGNDERVAVLNYGLHSRGEIGLEAGRERQEGVDNDLVGLTSKWTLAEYAAEGIGVAVAGGVFADPDTDRFQEAEVFFPVAVPLGGNDRAMFRYNLGWSHQRDADDRDVLTWGFGAEAELVPRVSAIVEIYGDQRDSTEIQTGVRLDLADLAALDVGYGRERRDRGTSWWTVGLAAEF